MDGQIAMAKRWTESSRAMFLKGLETTPDDKLTWSPSPTSRNVLQVAAHTAVANNGISIAIAGEMSGPPMTVAQTIEHSKAEESKITTRKLAIEAINSSCDTVLKALDKVTQARLADKANTPFGEIPMESLILIPSQHMDCHRSQIDYIQTIYGDLDWHMS